MVRLRWRIRDALGIPPSTTAETDTRLAWLASRTPRYRPGAFVFAFGRLRYVDVLSFRWQYAEIFGRHAYDFDCARPDPVILDCGANVGLSVIAFKHRYPTAHITAFEADPQIAEVLTANLTAAGLADVTVVQAAAWTQAGSVRFTRDGADAGRVDSASGRDEVRAIRLADFVPGRVDLLKLDIEGAEYAVLEDLCQTGRIKQIDRVVCEVHGRMPDREGVGRILTRLAEEGFSFTIAAARSAPDLAGPAEPTPFVFPRDGKFLLHLFAWRPST